MKGCGEKCQYGREKKYNVLLKVLLGFNTEESDTELIKFLSPLQEQRVRVDYLPGSCGGEFINGNSGMFNYVLKNMLFDCSWAAWAFCLAECIQVGQGKIGL